MSALSKYNKTLELQSIVEDKLINIFSSEEVFTKIINLFLGRLKKKDDKKLAVDYLISKFPNNNSLNSLRAGAFTRFWNTLRVDDYGLTENMRINLQYDRMHNVIQNKDWRSLHQLLEEQDFFEICRFPTSLRTNKHIFEKLQHHGIRIVELMLQCRNTSFQLNSIILKNLIFFFFLPKELEISNQEKTGLYQILGEILCNSWIQFEYHHHQLLQKNQDQLQLKNLKDILILVQKDSKMLYESIIQLVNKLLNYDTTSNLNYVIVENLIEKLLPINFDLQITFYLMCFYCLISFDNHFRKILAQKNRVQKYTLLNQYIQCRVSQNNQLNKELINQVQSYNKNQCIKKEELDKWKIWSIRELIEYVIEENFYNVIKKLHVINLNSQAYSQQNPKFFNLLTNISAEKIRKVAKLLEILIKEDSLIKVVLILEQQKQNYLPQELESILRIVLENSYQSIINFQLLYSVLSQDMSQTEKENIIKVAEYDENLPIEQKIQMLSNFSSDQLKLVFNQNVLINTLIESYLTNLTKNHSQLLEVLRRLFQINQQLEQQNQHTKLFSPLCKYLQIDQIHLLIYQNRLVQISLDDYKITISLLYKVFSKLQGQNQQEDFKMALESTSIFPSIYCFNHFLQLFLSHRSLEQITNIFTLVYYWQKQLIQQLQVSAELFCKQDPNTYSEQFSKINYFDINSLEVTKLQQKIMSDIYPRSLNISLEDFNISLTLLNRQQQEEFVQNWIQKVKDPEAFKQLIPFFFNIIKRGEPSSEFLTIINKQIIKQEELRTKYGCFNQKSIFQIFYNNADDELKVMLLKLISKQYPIPLLYRTSYFTKDGEEEKLTFNINTFYVFEENYSIINLSLANQQKRIGKTDLINKIFYKQYKFEISDNNYLNKQTIDIMYDFEFNGSRNLSVADAHGFIPYEILDDILPLFRMWIIQLDTEREIRETIQNLKKLKSFKSKQNVICLLIRNSIRDLDEQEIAELLYHNIQYKQVINLSDNDLNNQMKQAEIAQASKFLFDLINKNNSFTLKQDEYINQIFHMVNCVQDQKIQIKQVQDLFKDIEKELGIQMEHVDGFYNQNAFPLRSIEWQIKKEKDEYQKIQRIRQDKQTQEKLNQITLKIKQFQNSINLQKPTQLLIHFCNIFKRSNYYILYLHFVDKIRKFNEKNTYKLQRENQKLNEEIQKLRREKKNLQTQRDNCRSCTINEQINEIQTQIDELVAQLKQNSDIISKRNIGIELFWREVISQREQCQQSDIDFDPSQIVKEMISKGEPFEFLDGDSLKIDQPFLKQLISNFKEQGQERILVLSVLGPQSSGKSTILNKIFGCHFWTSVGRCTKGIYLQLLKVHNKAYFNNLFDYIIILDTEGLQSPNQDDSEFDKKIALFVLSISDIILVNVKGDITRDFRELVEMCVYTLGQMKSFTSTKLITWCFNQNNDVNNRDPFIAQLLSIATNLNKELSNQNQENEQIDYNEILGITEENIKVLGFASTEHLWKKNDSDGVYTNWRQLILNGTFSSEAYEQGIRIIQAYVNKFGKEDNLDGREQMENLKCFIDKIETTWKSIITLPDLLEFSQLIQHQQNQFMRKQFIEIINNYPFPTKIQFITQIHEAIKEQNQGLSIDILNAILGEFTISMNAQFDQINNEFLERLTQIKNEHKISKKVIRIYENMVKARIDSERSGISLAMLSEIRIQETSFQQKMGFIKIDHFILQLIGNENLFKQYKEDERKIETKFKELWNEILTQDKQKQDESFMGYSDQLLKVIKENFKNYILTTKNENSYKQQYMAKLNKEKPKFNDYLPSLEILKPELQTAQLMYIANSNKNYLFYENFNQNIEKKISRSSPNQVLSINQFYSNKVEITYLTLEDFNKYRQKDFQVDLESYCRLGNKIDKYSFATFLQNFSLFGYQISKQGAEQLFTSHKQFRFDINMLNSCFLHGERQYFGDAQYDSSIEMIQKHCKSLTNYYKKHVIITDLSQNNEIDNAKARFNEKEFFLISVKSQVIVKQNTGSQINKSRAYSIQQQNQEQIFNYILNRNLNSQYENIFKQSIARYIEELMSEINNERWKKVYCEIHQMILDEIKEMKAKQFSYGLIKRILQKIEGKIKDLNMQFSDFGVILNDLGERCIYYYAIFSIWRVLCYKQYRSSKKASEQLSSQEEVQYQKFKADIQQNKKEQSKIRGQSLAEEIINQTIARFQRSYCEEAKQFWAGFNKESNYDIIKQLDKDILERYDRTVTDEQRLHYIKNHTDYVEKYVKDNINKLKVEIQTKFTKKLQKDLNSYLQKVDANTKYLYDNVVSPLQAKDYFVQQQNPDEAPKLLFKITLGCLQGYVEQNLLQTIKPDKIHAFQTQDFHIFELPLCSSIQKSDEEIQILYNFVQAFKQRILLGIKNSDSIQVQLETLKLQDDLDAQQLRQIGCLQFCPLCKRKCDQEIDDSNHIHLCQNGHQLRGMTGVLIGSHPSLYTCEEIQDDFQISLLETSTIKQWKDIKQIYNGWIFSCLNKDELKSQKEKFMKIWNDNIGRMLCIKLTEEIGRDVFYVPKQEVELGGNLKTAHYLLILDDSGSMEGRPFQAAKSGLVAFLYEIQKNPESRVTIILFNHSARCVVDYQIPDALGQSQQIQYSGGGTDFDEPLKIAFDKIAKNPDFNKFCSHSIFFYTDGQAQYPSRALEKVKQFPSDQREKIELVACSQEENPTTLVQVVKFGKQYLGSAKIQASMEPQRIAQVWIEEVSQLTHQIKNC